MPDTMRQKLNKSFTFVVPQISKTFSTAYTLLADFIKHKGWIDDGWTDGGITYLTKCYEKIQIKHSVHA